MQPNDAPLPDAMQFCRRHVWLNGGPIDFSDRPYLREVYASFDGNVVLRCSRQVEKSTLLANIIIYLAIKHPSVKMLLVCPREDQANLFCKSRLQTAIANSPLIARGLLQRRNRQPIHNQRFANGSELFVRSAFHRADAARGISAEALFIDEFQDIAAGDLPVLQETLSHSPRAQTILAGTPNLVDNHLEDVYRRSTAQEWRVPCRDCAMSYVLDTRVIGVERIVCPTCQKPINVAEGQWVPANPHSTWGQGFWITHLMVPWIGVGGVLDRQRDYDPVKFQNECLGLPTARGDHVITREEIEACCGEFPMARSLSDVPADRRGRLVAGIDWGGGAHSATVLVIGEIQPNLRFTVFHIERLPVREEPQRAVAVMAQRCREFRVKVIAADGGGSGLVFNRLLLDKIGTLVPLFGIVYSTTDQQPVRDGALWRWTVNRSGTIGLQFARIKSRLLVLPRLADVEPYLREFTGVIAEYDDYTRGIRYTHPETQPDDTLHATNYTLLAARRYAQSY